MITDGAPTSMIGYPWEDPTVGPVKQITPLRTLHDHDGDGGLSLIRCLNFYRRSRNEGMRLFSVVGELSHGVT